MKETLMAVSQTLRGLFANKSELVGFDDWDKMVGCIMAIEQVANSIPDQPEEVKNDG